MYTFYLREKANVLEVAVLRDTIFWYLFIIFINFNCNALFNVNFYSLKLLLMSGFVTRNFRHHWNSRLGF